MAALALQARGPCLHLPSAGRARAPLPHTHCRPGGSCRPALGTSGARGLLWLESQAWSLTSGHALPASGLPPGTTAHRPPLEDRPGLPLVGSQAFGLEGAAPALEEQLEKGWAPPKKPQGEEGVPELQGAPELDRGGPCPAAAYGLCDLRPVTLPLCASRPCP